MFSETRIRVRERLDHGKIDSNAQQAIQIHPMKATNGFWMPMFGCKKQARSEQISSKNTLSLLIHPRK
uniref:Tyr recombinase domain-containing protein n=1 Tax=Syphacia muris TaxID=451379 RepID=A0A0N5ALR2_9BILA